MGKQYKKLIKRRRRTAYLARRKAAHTASKPSSNGNTKSQSKKSARTKATTSAKTAKESIAEKAKTEDVLGPDASETELSHSAASEDSTSEEVSG